MIVIKHLNRPYEYDMNIDHACHGINVLNSYFPTAAELILN